MQICWNCNIGLPDEAKYCFNCGVEQDQQLIQEDTSFKLPSDIEQQLTEDFFVALQEQLAEEQDVQLFETYREKVYESGFRDILKRKIQQLIEQLKELEENNSLSEVVILGLRDRVFFDLLDYFIIHFCKDLNVVALPEVILKYQDVNWSDINLFTMVMDYLDFDSEDELVYTDFLKMPVEKIKNAGKFFLFPEKEEKILFICDQSAFGSCKEGFALTDQALYWKAYLEKAKVVHYNNIRLLEKEKDWITINGFFFNVSRNINVKLLKLLRKINQLGIRE
ncbi:MAG: hypothetical protein MK226_10530 [Saprospiraceae bacterium]|nr:hypothetical protein [Saprospiraceae bacterium]